MLTDSFETFVLANKSDDLEFHPSNVFLRARTRSPAVDRALTKAEPIMSMLTASDFEERGIGGGDSVSAKLFRFRASVADALRIARELDDLKEEEIHGYPAFELPAPQAFLDQSGKPPLPPQLLVFIDDTTVMQMTRRKLVAYLEPGQGLTLAKLREWASFTPESVQLNLPLVMLRRYDQGKGPDFSRGIRRWGENLSVPDDFSIDGFQLICAAKKDLRFELKARTNNSKLAQVFFDAELNDRAGLPAEMRQAIFKETTNEGQMLQLKGEFLSMNGSPIYLMMVLALVGFEIRI